MNTITRRQRIAQAQERVRYHVERGREQMRGITRQFWQGLITGMALCVVAVFVLLLMTRA